MKNINILLFLSDNKKGDESYFYNLEGSEQLFEGIQTNEAPIRYLFDQAKKREGCIKRILCITSFKVLTDPKDDPQMNWFTAFVNDLTEEYEMRIKPELIKIPYDYDEITNTRKNYGREMPVNIYNRLSNCFQTITDEEEVFIDYTGGLRDISFLMTSIVRFLEFRGLRCGEIVYSNWQNKTLYDIRYIYDLYQMINGVNEFINTGNARELEKVYKGGTGDSPAEKVIGALIDFSDTLSICDVGKLDDRVNELTQALGMLENAEESDINSAMMKTLAPVIREKMYLKEKIDYPQMIRWCAENNMIQQAATIYTDKMPRYFFENDLVPEYAGLNEVRPTPGHDETSTRFYTELYDRAAEGLEVELFRRALKDIDLSLDESMRLEIILRAIEQKAGTVADTLRDAFSKLIDFVKNYFVDSAKGVSWKEGRSIPAYRIFKYKPDNYLADDDGYVRNQREVPLKFKDFWNSVTSENIYWRHWFLYENEQEYLKLATPSKRSKDKTFRKKAYAIQKIKEGTVDIGERFDSDKTYKMMAFYLAVKLMRNRMNHASDASRSNDEEEAIKYLNELEIGISFEDTIDSYKNILLKGVEPYI